MNENNRELEVKIPTQHIAEVEVSAIAAGGKLIRPMTLERNLRFDDSANSLAQTHRVLRLRDNGGEYILTYKSEKESKNGIADREEIETSVGSFDQVRLILERLGCRVCFVYEKYRAVYRVNGTDVMLDHTPIGDFIEIEGVAEAEIQSTAELIGLDWEARTAHSYRALFREWKARAGSSALNMTFGECA